MVLKGLTEENLLSGSVWQLNPEKGPHTSAFCFKSTMTDCSVFSVEHLSGLGPTGYGQEQVVTLTVHSQGVLAVLRDALGKVIFNCGFCIGRLVWSGAPPHSYRSAWPGLFVFSSRSSAFPQRQIKFFLALGNVAVVGLEDT